MSSVENKWWFIAIVSAGSAVLTQLLFLAAGLSITASGWTLVIFALCVSALFRLVSFLGWLAVLAIAPGLAARR